MSCDEVRESLAAYVGHDGMDLATRRHVARCEHCQAELARYEQLHEGLRSLTGHRASVPEGLVTSLVAIPRSQTRVDAVRGHLSRNRKAYLGGLALGAAGAAGALVWRRRRLVAA